MAVKDARNVEGLKKYSNHWAKNSSEDTQAHRDSRKEEYADVVNGYYDGATQLYEYGWGKSFHFSRFYPGEQFNQALARHEHYLAAQIGIKKGMRVLDVGCGVGGPARCIARFTDANIVGVNNNEYQVGRARKYTESEGLSDLVSFTKGDFTKLAQQFGENSFDAVYAIEATVHAPSFEAVYSEIFKVLKPGGTFGVYEWVMTDEWDPTIPEHKKIAHGIEIGDGIPEMRNANAAREALKSVGFKINVEDDLADRGDKISWYYPLEGKFSNVQSLWDLLSAARLTRVGRNVTHIGTIALEYIGLVPKGTRQVSESLLVAANALVKGGQTKLFTPMLLFVCTKPR